jgi:DNA-binding MarR family transcriptional regulator
MRTNSAAPPLAAHLRLAITRTARRMRQEAGAGLTPSQTAALATVQRHGPLTPSELAERERIKRPSATRLIANLEGEGLVVKTPDPADGRSCLVAVTAEGAALLAEVRTRKDAFLAERLRKLTPEDRATLRRAAEILEDLA